MTALMELLKDAPEQQFAPGETIIRQGQALTKFYVLKEGEVAVGRDDTLVSRSSSVGSTFGEISALLDIKTTASVAATQPTTMVVVDDLINFLEENRGTAIEIARLLAHRVRWMTKTYAEEMDDGDSAFWRYR